jgi:hypothetical protein
MTADLLAQPLAAFPMKGLLVFNQQTPISNYHFARRALYLPPGA